MMGLDGALAELKQPQFVGEIIKGLPCDLCDKPHTKVIGAMVATDLLLWEIHSPCLDKIAKQAVARVG